MPTNITMPPLQTMIFTMTATMVGLICVVSFTFLSSLIVMGKLVAPRKTGRAARDVPTTQGDP